jgi:eukaryotic-like serine/threonine-protein kinase
MSLTTAARLGPYEIVALLGTGGMGEVWKARDTRLNRIVAVKQLTGRHSDRFEQEARTIAALNHPHICQIYDVGADYLVLEYIEGRTLADRLRSGGRPGLPPEEALAVARQIAEGLEEAHRSGRAARDAPTAPDATRARPHRATVSGEATGLAISDDHRGSDGVGTGRSRVGLRCHI